MFNLSHRRALVTGAGQGMGAGIAQALAEQGALVYVNDLFPERAVNTVETITKNGGEARPLPGDITDKAVRAAMQADIMVDDKALDILVNNECPSVCLRACANMMRCRLQITRTSSTSTFMPFRTSANALYPP